MKSLIIIGNSHTIALRSAYLSNKNQFGDIHFINLNELGLAPKIVENLGRFILLPKITTLIDKVIDSRPAGSVAIASFIGGNIHTILSLVNPKTPYDFLLQGGEELPLLKDRKQRTHESVKKELNKHIYNNLFSFVDKLQSKYKSIPFYQLEPPAPVSDNSFLEKHPGVFEKAIKGRGVSPPHFRYKFWRLHRECVSEYCRNKKINFITIPDEALGGDGFLKPQYQNNDPTHGNATYGLIYLRKISDSVFTISKEKTNGGEVTDGAPSVNRTLHKAKGSMKIDSNKKQVVIVGNNHLKALENASASWSNDNVDLHFINLHEYGVIPRMGKDNSELILSEDIVGLVDEIVARGSEGNVSIVSVIGGSVYAVLSVLNHTSPYDFVYKGNENLPLRTDRPTVPFNLMCDMMDEQLDTNLFLYVKKLKAKYYNIPFFQLESPAPIFDNGFIKKYPGIFKKGLKNRGVSPAYVRYKFWKLQNDSVSKFCKENGITYVPIPRESLDGKGFLKPVFKANDPTHANAKYGTLYLDKIAQHILSYSGKSLHPYKNRKDYNFWKKAIVDLPVKEIDPVTNPKFQIEKSDKVVSAGSCFAQHIARYLIASGFNFLITEKSRVPLPEALVSKYNYGLFSARYGNVYTVRQLVQLFDRAFGVFTPKETVWRDRNNNFVDPFRPQIQPGGYSSEAELVEDTRYHLESTKKAFEEMDVFIFTLGLTEGWVNKEDGSVYPVCPGVAGGVYDTDKYEFKNFNEKEVVDDMLQFIDRLRKVNPSVRVILTVSPVPLIATNEDRHVLVSTVLSKSILRLACENVMQARESVEYFPSYELITGNFSRGKYFENDLRTASKSGVNHVMSVFLKNYCGVINGNDNDEPDDEFDSDLLDVEKAVQVLCDEEAIEKNS